MALSPLDIHNKEFHRQFFGGYDRDQVDEYLDIVIRDFESVLHGDGQIRTNPAEARGKRFDTRPFGGYDRQEVDAFMEEVVRDFEAILQQRRNAPPGWRPPMVNFTLPGVPQLTIRVEGGSILLNLHTVSNGLPVAVRRTLSAGEARQVGDALLRMADDMENPA